MPQQLLVHFQPFSSKAPSSPVSLSIYPGFLKFSTAGISGNTRLQCGGLSHALQGALQRPWLLLIRWQQDTPHTPSPIL